MPASNATVAICFHSGKGHTAAIADEIAAGARDTGAADAFTVDVTVEPVPWDRLFAADAIVFGCPTHFGGISAQMKTFLDATDTFWRDMRWRDKLAAGFTCAGEPSGDKQSTLMALSVFAAQHAMIWVPMDPMNDVRTGAGKPEGYNIQGGYLGAMSDSDGKAVTPNSPPQTDRLTARLFGRRIAAATLRWTLGAADRT
jgi:NAD(P)H dehydrogenase (quinone)